MRTGSLAATGCVGLGVLVASPSQPALPRLDLVATIGCDACGDATQFGSLVDVAVDDSARTLVLTDEAPMVRLFDQRGGLRWSTGREGSGPGEFRRPVRGVLSPEAIQVVDLSLRRVARLGPDGRLESTAPLSGFPAAIAGEVGSGGFRVLIDDFRSGQRLERWTPSDSGVRLGPVPTSPHPRAPGEIVFPSMAAGPGGTMALARDGNAYLIELLGPNGASTGRVSREVPQVRRTAAEREALDRITARAAARAAASGNRAGPRPAVTPRPGGDPDLKPSIAIDGLRFDRAGRLWVRTMRGDETVTIFDIFGPDLRFLGEVRVPGIVGRFSLAGEWLAVGTQTDDGVPVVRRYRVR